MSRKRMKLAETHNLIKLCLKHRKVLECKKLDAKSTSKKYECWKEIEKQFNLENGIKRDLNVLKNKYKNLKYGSSTGPLSIGKMSAILNGSDMVDNDADNDDTQFELSSVGPKIEYDPFDETTLPTNMSSDLPTSATDANVPPVEDPFESLESVKRLKLKAEAQMMAKMAEQIQLQNKFLEEKHRLEIKHAILKNKREEEKHKIEMEILNVRLDKEER